MEVVVLSVPQVKFWLEGVCLCGVGVFGVLGNVLSIVVLTRKEMRNSFNMLLVSEMRPHDMPYIDLLLVHSRAIL